MRTPKEIIVKVNNVHNDDLCELISYLADQAVFNSLRYEAYTKSTDKAIRIYGFTSLLAALETMIYLEKNCWDWEEKKPKN